MFWIALILVCFAVPTQRISAAPDDGRLAWWRDARFGMFIHWGPVSLTGKEIGWARGQEVPIVEYDQLYTKFNPIHFDAEAWVKTAKDAGMKYIVLTTKHHDGFCLWDTQQTEYNIMHSPFGHDVVKELSDACKRADIRFCAYYSTCDWHHPDFPLTSPGGQVRRETSNLDRYEQYLRAQVRELITEYGPLGLLWFDVPQEFDRTRGQGVIDFARSLQPNIIVNNRIGAPGDYDTPEQRVGKYQDDRPWETCMTICRQWAWKPNDDMKSLKECLQTLILCAGGDGNLLFNVGPMPDGRIESRQIDRLQEMGDWLAYNGESVYGTRGGPWKPTKAVAATRRGNTIYIHILCWNGDTLGLPDIDRRIESADLLSGGRAQLEKRDGKLIVRVAPSDRDAIDTIVKLTLDGSAMDIPALAVQKPVKAAASNVYHKLDEVYGPEQAFDNDPETRWATDNGTRQAWITVDLDRPLTIQKVRIDEAIASRVKQFELQYRAGEDWKTIFTGTTIGHWFQQSFTPVTAREFRVNILDASEGPTISDIEFYDK